MDLPFHHDLEAVKREAINRSLTDGEVWWVIIRNSLHGQYVPSVGSLYDLIKEADPRPQTNFTILTDTNTMQSTA